MGIRVVRQISYVLMLFTLSNTVSLKAEESKFPPRSSEKGNPASKNATPPTSEQGTAATIIEARYIESVLGKEVLSATDESLGRIVDVLADRSGQLRAAVIDFGGFLGVGNRKIAVDWSALRFEPKGSSSIIRCDLTRERLRVAPEVRPGEPIVIIGAGRSSNPSAKTK